MMHSLLPLRETCDSVCERWCAMRRPPTVHREHAIRRSFHSLRLRIFIWYITRFGLLQKPVLALHLMHECAAIKKTTTKPGRGARYVALWCVEIVCNMQRENWSHQERDTHREEDTNSLRTYVCVCTRKSRIVWKLAYRTHDLISLVHRACSSMWTVHTQKIIHELHVIMPNCITYLCVCVFVWIMLGNMCCGGACISVVAKSCWAGGCAIVWNGRGTRLDDKGNLTLVKYSHFAISFSVSVMLNMNTIVKYV